MRPCTGEEFLFVTFHVYGNAGFTVCLSAFFKDICKITGPNFDRVISGRGQLNVVSAEGSFAAEFPLYVSLKPNWSEGDIDCLDVI